MRAERMWTYEQVAEALAMHPRAVQAKVARMGLPRFRKPQSVRTYVRQSDVNRLFTAYWIRRTKGNRSVRGALATVPHGDNGSQASG